MNKKVAWRKNKFKKLSSEDTVSYLYKFLGVYNKIINTIRQLAKLIGPPTPLPF